MSLFPAYPNAGVADAKTYDDTLTNKVESSAEWLVNSSFQTEVPPRKPVIDISSDSSSDESVKIVSTSEVRKLQPEIVPADSDSSDNYDHKKSKHRKKHKRRKRKYKDIGHKDEIKYERQVDNVYFEDRFRDKRNCTVSTLCSRARPYYNMAKASLGFVPYTKSKKKQVIRRYHAVNIDYFEKFEKKDTTIKRQPIKDTSTDNNMEMETLDWGTNLEEEQTRRTREFNEKLAEDPNDVQLWLQYIHFQDVLAQFERGHVSKNSSSTTCLRKLAIVDKALGKNSNSKELLKVKLNLMAESLPADQFSDKVEALLNKDTGNTLLWQALIMASQASLALCTVPKVLSLYSKCLSTLRQRSRTNSQTYDQPILEMLYHCLAFLRHAGLWEQMWETLRLNLSLNLNLTKDSFRFRGSIDERKLIGMEEVILTSRLPLNQLWLRVESLRESCHWISVSSDQLELVGDSRRFVLPEDVADFIHPMASRNSNLRLAIYSLMSLKVPLLPTRDSAARDLKLKEFNWSADSVEVLLPLAYPSVGMTAGCRRRRNLLTGVLEGQLTSGPQYLQFHPAQEPYLDFVRDAFRAIAESLPPTQSERTSIYVWWLRFERLLVSLNDDDHRRKKLKSTLKEFLKKDENRNNLHFYREYALIEREAGRFDSCVNILETTIASQGNCPASISNVEEKAALLSIYRVLLETLLNTETYKESHRERILLVFGQMVAGPDQDRLVLAEKYMESMVQEFLEHSVPEETDDAYFLPNLECDLITCYAYFLYVKERNISEVVAMLETCLEHSKMNPYLQERLYESTVALMQLYCEQTKGLHGVLTETLNHALLLYPANFYMLSVFADIESDLPCWKLSSGGGNSEPWRALAMCLAGRSRVCRFESLGLQDAASAALNKLLSFHRKLAREPETQRCPLIWRLYMLLLRERNLCEDRGEEVYHESVEQCPWARGIYTDAAEIAPQLLTQIQDVIREKDLRMHVTPEELDILRG